MGDWESAVQTRKLKIKEIERLIPGYDYSTQGLAQKTDENLSALLIQNLGITKGVMFNILETAFERHRELLIKDYQNLRDDIDVFSDEIKARVFRWDPGKPQKWLEKLIDYDYRIVTGLGTFMSGIDSLEKEFLSSSERIPEVRKLDTHMKELNKLLDSLIVMFRERDSVCNIRDAVLEGAFDRMRKDISGRV